MNDASNTTEREIRDPVSLCPECPAGVMRLSYITYFTWLHGELVTVPNFPAWICDVCGRREFDPRAVTWLNTLLNPAAGGSNTRRMRRKGSSPRGDQPQP
ncbi:MAG TPA: YgiT-type zinc finger protein [Anaerolineales bacterium]|nr:YgiT-type zinc finger protein [Anaerolineales bacterium]